MKPEKKTDGRMKIITICRAWIWFCARAWVSRSARVPARSRSRRLLAASTLFSRRRNFVEVTSRSVVEMVFWVNSSSARRASARA
ncbi:MAG: hypothetical protein NTX27_01280 [Verrucomicrobia bacterium]|nr:hypothetical protein [Verrucomicrobiota bacterium]